MTRNDDFIGQLEDYLDSFDDVTPLPDRVRDAIRAELPSARQVRPRPGLERVLIMLSKASPGARLGLATAAVVAVVVLGAAFLNNGRSDGIAGVAPTPTPAPTPSPALSPSVGPTAAPSVAALPPSLADGVQTAVACDPTDTGKSCAAPGRYQLTGNPGVWPVTVTIDLPAGWFEPLSGNLGAAWSGWDAVLVQGGADTHYSGTGWGVMFTTVGDVYRDPCDDSKGTIPAAQVDTPQKLAAAIAAWPGFTATAAQPITVDGHSGLELKVTKKARTAACASGKAWVSSSGAVVDAYPFANGPAYATTIRIVDTGHGLLAIRASDFPNTSPYEVDQGLTNTPNRHAADQTALHAILDSIHLIGPPASS